MISPGELWAKLVQKEVKNRFAPKQSKTHTMGSVFRALAAWLESNWKIKAVNCSRLKGFKSKPDKPAL
jgi:hypothetical protein